MTGITVVGPDVGDVRPLMEWETSIAREDRAECSVPKCGYVGTDTWVTRHEWKRMPLGYLYTRCPDHQALYEKRMQGER